MKAKRTRRELLLYGVALVLFLAFLYYVTRDRDNSIEERSANDYSTRGASTAGRPARRLASSVLIGQLGRTGSGAN